MKALEELQQAVEALGSTTRHHMAGAFVIAREEARLDERPEIARIYNAVAGVLAATNDAEKATLRAMADGMGPTAALEEPDAA